MLDDYGATLAVQTAAAALELATGTRTGRNLEPGADLTSSPAAGIEAAAPFATFGQLGRCVTVAWRLRFILGRWETSSSLSAALDAYRATAPELRRAGFNVGPLEAPAVATIAGVPHLAAAFPVSLTVKES